MALRFNNAWRFAPPEDGIYRNKTVPEEVVEEFFGLALKVATQGSRQGVLENFKGEFCAAVGSTHARSSNESWAATDLESYMRGASENAPLFIEAFYDACASLGRRNPDWFVPDTALINKILQKYRMGYEVRPPELLLLDAMDTLIAVPEPLPTLAEKAIDVLQSSLHRSEELLAENRSREAVQEILWLLETVSTAFRGLDTESGTVEGKYFNHIVKDLRGKHIGTTLARVLEWVTNLHGYLSSPTGGGIRHGVDLDAGVRLSSSEARLYCNLIRSYLAYLVTEHERLSGNRHT